MSNQKKSVEQAGPYCLEDVPSLGPFNSEQWSKLGGYVHGLWVNSGNHDPGFTDFTPPLRQTKAICGQLEKGLDRFSESVLPFYAGRSAIDGKKIDDAIDTIRGFLGFMDTMVFKSPLDSKDIFIANVAKLYTLLSDKKPSVYESQYTEKPSEFFYFVEGIMQIAFLPPIPFSTLQRRWGQGAKTLYKHIQTGDKSVKAMVTFCENMKKNKYIIKRVTKKYKN